MKTEDLARACASARWLALAACACLPIAANPRPAIDYGRIPLFFEANHGQAPASVRYVSRGGGHALYLQDTSATLALASRSKVESLRFEWLGAHQPQIEAGARQAGSSHYLIGADASSWRTNVPHFGKVTYRGLYDGIDLVYYGNQGELEYDLIVAPGSDPGRARLAIAGAQRVSLTGNGDLMLATAAGDVRQRKPVAYQIINGKRSPVEAAYLLRRGEIGFRIGTYDRREPLIIDPVLVYSAFFGGTNVEQAESVALDPNGNAYITGQTVSTNLPVVSAVQPASGGGAADAFVMKINAAGTQILYATYLGGNAVDVAHGIAVDATGAAYVTGETTSTNFPTTAGWRTTRNGTVDAFLTKLQPSGAAFAMSTYIGGSAFDAGQAVAVDSANNVYVTGYTSSADLHNLLTGQSFNGTFDAFLVKITGAAFAWSTYAGGTGNDRAYAVAVYNADGSVYIAGETASTNLAGTAVQPGNAGSGDAFVAKFASAGGRTYWAYLGGTSADTARGVAVDSTGNVYVAGQTASANFPIVNASQPTFGGHSDAFVTKYNALGTAILYSTYLGGSAEDAAWAVAVDPADNAYVAGHTISQNFPVLSSAKSTPPGSGYDAFVTKFNSTGATRVYSSLFGGTGSDLALGLAVDGAGAAYLTGRTLSADMPVTLTGSSLRVQDAFIAKLGGGCAYTLDIASIQANAGGGVRYVRVDTPADCNWTATSNSGFLTFVGAAAGTGPGWVGVSTQANQGVARNGSVTIAGQNVAVSQVGSVAAGCTYLTSSSAANVPASGTTATYTITPSAPGCTWGAYSTTAWAQVYPLSGTGNTTISYTVFPNFSTTVRTATIYAGARALTITQAGNPLTPDQRFVQLLYFNYFGRLPSQPEIDFQVTQALNKGVPRGDLANNFLNTPEFNVGGRFVAGLYVGILNRDAEYGGWLFQRNALASGIVTQDSLLQNFLGSAEYAAKFGNPDNAAFVRLLYRYILLREGNDAEVAFQVSQLTSGTARYQLARAFLQSDEFINGTGPRLTSFLLYATLLLRDPTPPELAFRVQQLSSTPPTPVATLTGQFVGTPEFAALLQ